MGKPYVVSGDAHLLLKVWAKEKCFILPSADFFDRLMDELKKYLATVFGEVHIISARALKDGLNDFLQANNLPAVSLDRIYLKAEHNLEVTRAFNGVGNYIGLKSRAGTPDIEEQLAQVIKKIRDLKNPGVILYDDVIYSGSVILSVKKLLEEKGIKVSGVCSAIGVKEGVQKIEADGLKVNCVYKYEDVIDEVCERDFYPGVPLSGRLIGESGNVGSPYLLPFGKPGEWASIPEDKQLEFSQFCWKQTSRLFSAIEQKSGKPVMCSDLGRHIINFPTNGVRYTDAIKTIVLDKMDVE